GSGIDSADKAVAKAQTMAVKYAWKNTLLIADKSDDPDADVNSWKTSRAQSKSNRLAETDEPTEVIDKYKVPF
ncbi:MAG: ERF family protein, partial [Selenomonadaceae bacterium]|nr:ERF family protein [Selenomonadaceae bacterium]